MTSLMQFRWVMLFFVVSIVLFLVGHFIETIFMAFGAGVFSMGICLLAFQFITTMVLSKTNDEEQILTKGNIAYAVYLIAIAFVICVSYASAFVVFLALK